MISARGSELEDKDGLDEAGDPGCRAAEFTEEGEVGEGVDGAAARLPRSFFRFAHTPSVGLPQCRDRWTGGD